MTRHRYLEAWASFLSRHPRPVLLVWLLLLALAAGLALRLQFRSSRSGLASGRHDYEARMDRYVKEFGSPDLLVVVAAGKDPATLDRFADMLGERLDARKSHVRKVEWKMDPAYFSRTAFYHASIAELESVATGLEENAPLLEEVRRVDGVVALDRAIASALRRQAKAPAPAGEDAGAGPLVGLLEKERDFLRDPEGFVRGYEDRHLIDLLAPPPGSGRPGFPRGGYIGGPDGLSRYVLVTPAGDPEDSRFLRPFLAAVKDEVAVVLAHCRGVHVTYAGQPALVAEEMAAVSRDSWTTTLLGVGGVSILGFFAFRRIRLTLPVLASLGTGAILAAGFAGAWPGYLTVITACFASIVVGLGIDFGVHLVTQVEIELDHGHPFDSAVSHAIVKTGSGIVTSSITTILAFLSLLLMDFPGFSQLGILAGAGVAACLLTMLSLLPALLHWLRPLLEKRMPPPRRNGGRTASGERIALGITSTPWLALALWVVVLVFFGMEARRVVFDPNLRNLLPPGSEALLATERLIKDPEFFPDYAVSICENEAILRARQAECANRPTVARCQSVLDVLPGESKEKEPLLHRIARTSGIDAWALPPARPLDLKEAREAHRDMALALTEVQELAFEAGRMKAVEDLEKALAAVKEGQEVLDSAGPEYVALHDRASARLRTLAAYWVRELRGALHSPPPSLEGLPRLVVERYLGHGALNGEDRGGVEGPAVGRSLLYIYPKGDVWDRENLSRFVEDAYAIDPEATGIPVVYHGSIQIIVQGFKRASIAALLLVLLSLGLDFRDVRETVLACIPLLAGIVLMLGTMVLLGIPFNLANLVILPLILGMGVGNGVHILHRFRYEGRQGMVTVVRHTGRAIFISATTTMVGFGAMYFAHHRGMQSLGIVLFWGIGACLLTATLLLPNVLTLYFRFRPDKSTAGMEPDE